MKETNQKIKVQTKPPDKWPEDVRHQWLGVIRRLQSVARTQQGFAMIQIAVFVNQDGFPIQWTEPKLTRLEPKTPNDEFLGFLENFP